MLMVKEYYEDRKVTVVEISGGLCLPVISLKNSCVEINDHQDLLIIENPGEDSERIVLHCSRGTFFIIHYK